MFGESRYLSYCIPHGLGFRTAGNLPISQNSRIATMTSHQSKRETQRAVGGEWRPEALHRPPYRPAAKEAKTITYGDVRQAMEIWDHGAKINEQRSQTLENVQALLEPPAKIYESDESASRPVQLYSKLQNCLQRILFTIGYTHFSYTVESRSIVLTAYARPGMNPPPIPQWMPLHMVRTKAYESFRPLRETGTREKIAGPAPASEGREDELILGGDALRDPRNLEKEVGTLGALLQTQEGNLVAITAGHVLSAGEQDVSLKLRRSEKVVQLSAITWPIPSIDKIDWVNDESGILSVKEKNYTDFHWHIPRIHFNYFAKPGQWPVERMKITDSGSRPWDILERMGDEKGFYVYKQGIGTGFTTGCFSDVHFDPPAGWYGAEEQADDGVEFEREDTDLGAAEEGNPDGESRCEEKPKPGTAAHHFNLTGFCSESDSRSSCSGSSNRSDEDRVADSDDEINTYWFGEVEWCRVPFSANGDSGALVYAKEGDTVVPLGIHVG
ncbi:hypothetical protein BCR34DRAFT_392874 [Clohesyomyces aquaticus]|uniref:Uncharacterized protein n=1 Tax=Clohesyomyces aquaticus TaxID=1231657 RepID=A0A1Y1ZEE3_9PLEO|nr:hypothetical protein BCR34DRAFT_392874 [Clohesyomyces aquaticus]